MYSIAHVWMVVLVGFRCFLGVLVVAIGSFWYVCLLGFAFVLRVDCVGC